ncbi:hypothetical protein GCM10011521_09940 [Arenimonas soli]|uniref:Translocation protein TolB n=1 Tax=Arenimonas soli TaxID=2269504 RepID=A0ABQ1HGG5_9GAMM|nr:PA2928 family protein [Arenimonas soli]GGA73825.1 hypothetical protein GCM10011521_09940 [Arenimonas soli]
MGVKYAWLAVVALFLAGCNSSHYEEPEIQGNPGLVQHDEGADFVVLTQLEEVREVKVGGGRHSITMFRKDTYFHFDLSAYDGATLEPSWTLRLATYGDPDLKPFQRYPSKVVGSSVSGRMLGKDGNRIWLLIDSAPYVVDATRGELVLGPDALLDAQPSLEGLLPTDARFWKFDRGPVVTLADGRTVRLAGESLAIEDWAPPPAKKVELPTRANGMPRIIPTPPMQPKVRHVPRDDRRWLALLADSEALDAVNDENGNKASYPYSIADQGPMARRRFHEVRLDETVRFEERLLRIVAAESVPDSPVLLRARFVRDPFTGEAMPTDNGDLLVLHTDRVDDAGTLQLARLGQDLQPRWQAALPLGDESGFGARFWPAGDHLVFYGWKTTVKNHVLDRRPHVVSVSLADGRVVARNLAERAQ